MAHYKEAWKCDIIPEGESGPWRIEKFTVTEKDAQFDALRGLVQGSGRHTPKGDYTRLLHRSSFMGPVMSDTPDERRDHLPIIWRKGRILLNGLGLGCVARCLLEKEDVTLVHIVEKSSDVIKLVAPHMYEKYGNTRLQIFEDDAFTFRPPEKLRKERYDAVWHDIWPEIRLDYLEEMKKLHRRYGRWAFWQGSWSREHLEAQRRREKRYPRGAVGGWHF